MTAVANNLAGGVSLGPENPLLGIAIGLSVAASHIPRQRRVLHDDVERRSMYTQEVPCDPQNR
ncbi:MAG: hypothetical protein AB7R89_06425 [Dehalococcoidia bacterium]